MEHKALWRRGVLWRGEPDGRFVRLHGYWRVVVHCRARQEGRLNPVRRASMSRGMQSSWYQAASPKATLLRRCLCQRLSLCLRKGVELVLLDSPAPPLVRRSPPSPTLDDVMFLHRRRGQGELTTRACVTLFPWLWSGVGAGGHGGVPQRGHQSTAAFAERAGPRPSQVLGVAVEDGDRASRRSRDRGVMMSCFCMGLAVSAAEWRMCWSWSHGSTVRPRCRRCHPIPHDQIALAWTPPGEGTRGQARADEEASRVVGVNVAQQPLDGRDVPFAVRTESRSRGWMLSSHIA